MNKKTIKDLDVKGKRVFVRVDFNVPMNENREITDDTRIAASLPTIKYLVGQGAMVILASHLGRPKGKPNDKYRLDPVAKRLGELLAQEVAKVDDCIGPVAANAVGSMKPGDVLLLENVRFHAEEEQNEPGFSRQLADLADIYVNDAFGTAHRAHASTAGVAHLLPSAAGFLMQKEIEVMGKALSNPERPFAAIIGGAKVSDKIGVLENLIGKVDALLVGGGMANTFLKAQGYEVGKSLLEPDKVDLARELLSRAKAKDVAFLLPVDVVVSDKMEAGADHRVIKVDAVPSDSMILDIGPQTVALFLKEIKQAGTVVWNGPMGVFEIEPFAKGTRAVAYALAGARAVSIVGGGDSVAAVEGAHLGELISHISTGGGASLEFLEGRELPGVAALADKQPKGRSDNRSL